MTPFAVSIVVYMGVLGEQIGQLQAIAADLNSSAGQTSPGPTHTDPLVVRVAADQKTAHSQIREEIPDLLVMETDINQESRLGFCRWMRKLSPHTTVVVTGRIKPRQSSAYDEFLRMPFQAEAVTGLLVGMLASRQERVIEAGGIRLHRIRRVVEGPVGRHQLSPKQAALLALFLQNPGVTLERRDLVAQVWKTAYLGDTRTLDVHMHWLREKIEPNPSRPVYLEMMRGVGYRLRPDGE